MYLTKLRRVKGENVKEIITKLTDTALGFEHIEHFSRFIVFGFQAMSFVTDDKVNWRNARSKFFALNERLEAYYLSKVLRAYTTLRS